MSQSVVVVGGTSGIGLHAGLHLCDAGYSDVILAGRRAPTPARGGPASLPPGVRFEFIDVRDEESIVALFGRIERLDGLVYSAGVAVPKRSVAEFDAVGMAEVVATNLTGALLALKHAHRALGRVGGRVVFVGSVAVRTGSALSGVEYTASKAGLAAAVRQLAADLAVDGVRINAVHPSMTLTPMLERAIDLCDQEQIAACIPLGRLATPDDVSRAIAFLLDPMNSYITGAAIDVNGGLFGSA